MFNATEDSHAHFFRITLVNVNLLDLASLHVDGVMLFNTSQVALMTGVLGSLSYKKKIYKLSVL